MNAKQRPNQLGATRRVVAGSASWLALVAATSLGIPHAETLRAEIKLPPEALESGGRYRLIVQSYDTLGRKSLIPSGRPRASTQRTVTPADLVDGVRIDLIERWRPHGLTILGRGRGGGRLEYLCVCLAARQIFDSRHNFIFQIKLS